MEDNQNAPRVSDASEATSVDDAELRSKNSNRNSAATTTTAATAANGHNNDDHLNGTNDNGVQSHMDGLQRQTNGKSENGSVVSDNSLNGEQPQQQQQERMVVDSIGDEKTATAEQSRLTGADATSDSDIVERPETSEKERTIISELDARNRQMVIGDTWYVLSSKWFNEWKDWVKWDQYSWKPQSNSPPGSINNKPLLEPYEDDTGMMKRD
jgi:hypothetical protein